jgi:hypothetical protein
MDENETLWNPDGLPEDAGDARLKPAADSTPTGGGRRGLSRAATGRVKLVGTVALAGIAGAAIAGPLSAMAASPSPSATAATGSGTTGSGATGTTGTQGHGRAPGQFGFRGDEAVSDTSVVANAIGISEADLSSALQGGQTVAAVAKAHNVDVQKVIDALVADGESELAADVKAGKLTQAQADAMKSEVTQRATAQVNGTFQGH